jgi:hypothetical protein
VLTLFLKELGRINKSAFIISKRLESSESQIKAISLLLEDDFDCLNVSNDLTLIGI